MVRTANIVKRKLLAVKKEYGRDTMEVVSKRLILEQNSLRDLQLMGISKYTGLYLGVKNFKLLKIVCGLL